MSLSTEQPNVTTTFDWRRYNGVNDLGEADRRLQREAEIDRFFDEVGALVLEHRLEDLVGVNLVHKHNTVGSGELMVEQPDTVNDRKALVMSPEREDLEDDFWPVMWKFDREEKSFWPMENSVTPTARAGYERLTAARGFFPSFQALLERYAYEDLMGLVVLRTGELKEREEESIVERCHPTRVGNVLTSEVVPPEDDAFMVTTTWSFARKDEGQYGETEGATVCVKCEQRCQATGSGQPHFESHQASGPHS